MQNITPEDCIKAQCWLCRTGDTPERLSDGDWVHTMIGFEDRTEYCAAARIVEMMFQRMGG